MKSYLIKLSVICAASLFLCAPAGFAYSTWTNGTQGGCKTCHAEGPVDGSATAPQLHGVDAHIANCADCHDETSEAGTVSPSACTVCHPISGDNGLCPLINAPAHEPVQATCLVCHDACTPTTTTTIEPVSTTTTPATTTVCLEIEPDEVTVDGGPDQSIALTVTFTRPDLAGSGLTAADLQHLVFSSNESCASHITIDPESIMYFIGADTIRATLTAEINGRAPSTACLIQVADPQGIASPPLECEAVFTITSMLECQIATISPNFVRIGLGVLPRLRLITITADRDLMQAGITAADLSFDRMGNAIVLSTEISADQIQALVLFWGVAPGRYSVDLGPCGMIPFEVRFF